MIATSRQSATRAIMPAIGQSFAHSLPAQARLACPARVDLDYFAPGAFSLVRDHPKEHRPARIVDRLRQHSACEPLDVQILDGDHAVLVDQLAGELVVEVGSLIPQ